MGADSLHLTLLTGFDIRVGSELVSIKGARTCQVLAYMALHQGVTVSPERLSEALWGDEPPASARNSIQRFVSDVRRDLGPARARLASVGNGYRLELRDGDRCDAVALEAALPSAREALADGRPTDVLMLLADVPMTVAEPLASIGGAYFVDGERDRLSELLADVGETRTEAQLAQGDSSGAAIAARRLLDQHPYRERLCITLATALTRSGRANDALDAVVAFRAQARDDLGLDPSPALEQTELDILLHRDVVPLGLDLASPSSERQTSFERDSELYGRSALIAEAFNLLETRRVVTLSGTGGIGKTSAALAVIDVWHARRGGTARFVSLEDADGPGLVASIGRVVGTSPNADADPLDEIVDRISAQVDLLVLDNCEHIVDEVGIVVDEMVKRDSEVRILVTSRCPLGKVYEALLPLPPLDGGASRSLLRQEVQRAGVDLSSLDEDSISELLGELDGLPLAIELAGASLGVVGVSDLLSRWRTDEVRPNQRRERHLSIANAVRSSLDRLDTDERRLLALCALFSSDFTAAALEGLGVNGGAALLQGLCEHSLLEVIQTPASTRYRMLVPIRSEVRSQFGPLDQEHRDAFAAYFSQLSRECLEKMKGTESLIGVTELRSEISNIAVAFNLAEEVNDVATMASIVHSVGLANGMSPSVSAKSHLRGWCERLRERAAANGAGDEFNTMVRTAVAWGLYGSNDGAWYQRWETDSAVDEVETLAMASIARFSCGQSAEAWELLRDLDLTAVSDPYMRAMLCGVGSVIAFEAGASEGTALAAASARAASAKPSHGASFFAGLARSTAALVAGDAAACIGILETAVEAVDGHGLVTLENMGLAGVAMTVGFILGERDPAVLLVGLLDRYLEQHSLDPASVAMALDVAVLQLDRSDRTTDAARLLGLLDRLGLSMAIMRGPRSAVEARIKADDRLAKERLAGSTKTTFEVLRSTRSALAAVAEGNRSSG